MSIKKDIINKVIERLKTLESIKPTNGCELFFFKNPYRPNAPEEFPCVKVAFARGATERINNAIEYEWTDQLVVAYQAQGNDNDLEDLLYDSADAIADFLIDDENDSGNPEALHHLISDLELKSWEMDLQAGNVGTGAIVLIFDLKYHTKHEIEFGDLDGFDITIKPKDSTPATEPIYETKIDLPKD